VNQTVIAFYYYEGMTAGCFITIIFISIDDMFGIAVSSGL